MSRTQETQSGQSLLNQATTGGGRALSLPSPTDRFSFTAHLDGSTKCVVRLQGSVCGIYWTDIGSAATTHSSTASATIHQATSNRIVSLVRMNVSTLPAGRKVSGWIAGKGA